jgi:hypothetical protein
MAAGLATNLLYRYHTRSDGIIHVKDKYMYTRLSSSNGNTYSTQQFTIVDKEDKLYTIPYSVLSLQFDAEDKWSKMAIGKTYRIQYWGIRQPLLGLYPRIDSITEVQNDSPKVL